ncbi:MAG TPA: sigma-70 family RNA polymerase sigma factor [Methylibium sp.]|uniref:sigma-70 family RNA polymerase sigma factor n=1 Tax=Methylibium sp. TaxID=2067992 RepID=UPI002DBF1142|nr:sigma-70 family RNA polymerase sigma factor [Methylibium sp.]HEU4460516.1 sigma-70 family RNA polymerase sigma factor [Methylibium sp.]
MAHPAKPTTDWSDKSRELAAVMSRVALGDRAAFGTLYDATSAHLLGVVLRIQKDRAQAEDVLQEVYVSVWRAAQGFDATLSQPLTWLTSIARNRAIDSLRRRQAEPTTVSNAGGLGDDDETDMLDHLASPNAGPFERLADADDARALRGCIGALSGEQQQSLALAFFQGLSHAEVAEHLKQPLGTVKSWVRRGLIALKSCLERNGAV